MLAKRIIPCLDVHAGRVVKGTNFLQLRDAGAQRFELALCRQTLLVQAAQLQVGLHPVVQLGSVCIGGQVGGLRNRPLHTQAARQELVALVDDGRHLLALQRLADGPQRGVPALPGLRHVERVQLSSFPSTGATDGPTVAKRPDRRGRVQVPREAARRHRPGVAVVRSRGERPGRARGADHVVDRREVLALRDERAADVHGGRDLRAARLAKASMDASDGLYAAMLGLTVEQGLGFEFYPSKLIYPEYVKSWSGQLNIDPMRLALGFGNLELVCAASEADGAKLRQIARRNGVNVSPLGRVVEGDSVFLVDRRGNRSVMQNFDNERFTKESQFTGGLDAYKDRLLS